MIHLSTDDYLITNVVLKKEEEDEDCPQGLTTYMTTFMHTYYIYLYL